MCQDLSNLSCWSRLPTQLILLVISYLYKIEIIIINSNLGHETTINAYESIKIGITIDKVYLGHIGESHYVPIDILQENKEFEPLFYTDAKTNLTKWGSHLESLKIKEYNNSLVKNEKDSDSLIICANNNFQEIQIDANSDQVEF